MTPPLRLDRSSGGAVGNDQAALWERVTGMGEAAAKQLGFDLGSDTTPSFAPAVADIRTELQDILATMRAVDGVPPWDARTFRYHRTVFPQMARWLPADERDQLCFEFQREAERIELLLAA